MRVLINHGDNSKCPTVLLDGATHCPGHWVETETLPERHLAALAWGRGYRRCLEHLIKNPLACILLATGHGEELRKAIREKIAKEMGDEFTAGWDSFESQPHQK